MPLDLTRNSGPIDENDPVYQDFLADLQGNILNGHGRDNAVHIFLQFSPAKVNEVKTWISNIADTTITSAKSQLQSSEHYKETKEDAGIFAHFAITGSGYDYGHLEKLAFAADLRP